LETDYQRGIIVTHRQTGTQTHIEQRKTGGQREREINILKNRTRERGKRTERNRKDAQTKTKGT